MIRRYRIMPTAWLRRPENMMGLRWCTATRPGQGGQKRAGFPGAVPIARPSPSSASLRARRPDRPVADGSATRARGRIGAGRSGQSIVEFAIVVPLLLLIFAAAADLGRAFYGYVAVENAAKEGALYGSRNPLCDDASVTCAGMNNVTERVQKELGTLRNADGTEIAPTVDCLSGSSPVPLNKCAEGDTYVVGVTYEFRLLTPILTSVVGDLDLRSTAYATVLNEAFDPAGVSALKLVSPMGAINEREILDNCLELDDFRDGYYRSPCRNTTTADPTDVLYLRFQEGETIEYRIAVANSGGQILTGLQITDSLGWPSSSSTCRSRPSSLAPGAEYTCTYTRRAPNISGSALTRDFVNAVVVDATQIEPTPPDAVTVIIERPPPDLRVIKSVSPFEEGGDEGDGDPSFGFEDDLTVAFNSQIPEPSVWYRVVVMNRGGQVATGLQITDSNGPLPYGQDNANAHCDARPSTLAVSDSFICRYRQVFSSPSARTITNVVAATATNVPPNSADDDRVDVTIETCTGSRRVVPNLIGLQKAAAEAEWTRAGFTRALDTWSGQSTARVVSQDRQAFECRAADTRMRVGR